VVLPASLAPDANRLVARAKQRTGKERGVARGGGGGAKSLSLGRCPSLGLATPVGSVLAPRCGGSVGTEAGATNPDPPKKHVTPVVGTRCVAGGMTDGRPVISDRVVTTSCASAASAPILRRSCRGRAPRAAARGCPPRPPSARDWSAASARSWFARVRVPDVGVSGRFPRGKKSVPLLSHSRPSLPLASLGPLLTAPPPPRPRPLIQPYSNICSQPLFQHLFPPSSHSYHVYQAFFVPFFLARHRETGKP